MTAHPCPERNPIPRAHPHKTNVARTQHFLRRGAGHKSRPVLQSLSTTPSVHDRHAEMRKPPVPSHVCPSSSGSERVVYDHIYANAMDAITVVRRPPRVCLIWVVFVLNLWNHN